MPRSDSRSWAGAVADVRIAARTNQENGRMIFRCSLNLSCFARLEGDGYGVVSAKELIRVLKFVDGNVFVLDRQDRNHAAHERGPCQFFSTHGGRDQVG